MIGLYLTFILTVQLAIYSYSEYAAYACGGWGGVGGRDRERERDR